MSARLVYLHAIGMSVFPFKKDSILVVDSNGVLSFSIVPQHFKLAVGRCFQVMQTGSRVKKEQLLTSNPFERLPLPAPHTRVEKGFRLLVPKAFDHPQAITHER